jgi:surfactin family lipopeptide synthetase A
VQQALAGIWAQLLQLDQVGLHDNFFELGGHSLHGIRLIARVLEQLSVRISPIAVFQNPTVFQMAQVVESMQTQEVAPSATPVELEQGVI